jgi:nucleoside-diphosphate-sugar epimerase
LGSAIRARLEADNWQVVDLSRAPQAGGVRFELGERINLEALRGCDALVHCAYDFRPVSWGDVEAVNVTGSLELLRAAQTAGVERLVFISTISAFEGCTSLYGRGKLEVERGVHALGGISLRPGLVWGAKAGGLFERLARQVRTSSLVPLPDGGRPLQYLAHQADVAVAVSAALTRAEHTLAAPVTVAHATPWPLAAIVTAIAKALDRRIVIAPAPWRAMWMALRAAELLHVPLGVRSDSLISLMRQDPAPHINVEQELGVTMRGFDPASLNLDSGASDR